jgi:hypothetical protein
VPHPAGFRVRILQGAAPKFVLALNVCATRPSDSGTAYGLSAGITTISACTGSICGSTVLTVTGTAPGPTISSLNPTAGPVDTSVTITGTNFGTSQDIRLQ